MDKITLLKEFRGSTPIDRDSPDFGILDINSGTAIQITDADIEKQIYSFFRDYRFFDLGIDKSNEEIDKILEDNKLAYAFKWGLKTMWDYIKSNVNK